MSTKTSTKWKIDTHNKTISFVKHTFSEKIIGFFGFPKFSVNKFYSFLMDSFSSPNMMSFEEPMGAEGIKDSSAHYPRYIMINNWSINKKDLKHLIKGPLISEDGNIILVDKTPFFKTTWEIIKAVLYIMGGILTIYGFIQLIIVLF